MEPEHFDSEKATTTNTTATSSQTPSPSPLDESATIQDDTVAVTAEAAAPIPEPAIIDTALQAEISKELDSAPFPLEDDSAVRPPETPVSQDKPTSHPKKFVFYLLLSLCQLYTFGEFSYSGMAGEQTNPVYLFYMIMSALFSLVVIILFVVLYKNTKFNLTKKQKIATLFMISPIVVNSLFTISLFAVISLPGSSRLFLTLAGYGKHSLELFAIPMIIASVVLLKDVRHTAATQPAKKMIGRLFSNSWPLAIIVFSLLLTMIFPVLKNYYYQRSLGSSLTGYLHTTYNEDFEIKSFKTVKSNPLAAFFTARVQPKNRKDIVFDASIRTFDNSLSRVMKLPDRAPEFKENYIDTFWSGEIKKQVCPSFTDIRNSLNVFDCHVSLSGVSSNNQNVDAGYIKDGKLLAFGQLSSQQRQTFSSQIFIRAVNDNAENRLTGVSNKIVELIEKAKTLEINASITYAIYQSNTDTKPHLLWRGYLHTKDPLSAQDIQSQFRKNPTSTFMYRNSITSEEYDTMSPAVFKNLKNKP